MFSQQMLTSVKTDFWIYPLSYKGLINCFSRGGKHYVEKFL